MKKLLLTLTILSVTFFLNGLVYSQEFTNESFQGNYAFSGFAGPKVVYLGVEVADGDGNLIGSAINHRTWGRRIELTLEGTYTVNADGTGVVTGTLSDEADEEPAEQWDFVIMQAEVVDGVKLATEIYMVDRIGIRGNPVRFFCKRLPDNQEFTNESFQGTYAFYESAGPIDASFGLGFVDGKGNYAGQAVLRLFNKVRDEVLLKATYDVNADGTSLLTGTVADPSGENPSPEQTGDMIITQAVVVNGVKLATELFWVQKSFRGFPPAAITLKRLPD